MTAIATKHTSDPATAAYLLVKRTTNACVVRNCLKARAAETKDPRLMTALLVVAGAEDLVLDKIMRSLK